MGDAHGAIADFMKEKNLRQVPPAIEEYVSDPKIEKDTAKWQTNVIYFVEPNTYAQ